MESKNPVMEFVNKDSIMGNCFEDYKFINWFDFVRGLVSFINIIRNIIIIAFIFIVECISINWYIIVIK